MYPRQTQAINATVPWKYYQGWKETSHIVAWKIAAVITLLLVAFFLSGLAN